MPQTRSSPESEPKVKVEESENNCHLCSSVDVSKTLPKRLIVCCDGTFNSSNQGVETNPTNIARLSRAIATVGYSPKGVKMPQITYYQAGIGTDPTASGYTKARQGGLGAGLNGKVCEAYNYLANNYERGDEIFIFGFSRGAYTARSLANFICQFGLLPPGMMDYFDEIFEAYKKRGYSEHSLSEMAWAQETAKPGELGLEMNSTEKISRYDCIKDWTHLHVKIRCVGVFDTVGSVGMSGYVAQPGQDVDWHSTSLQPKMEYAFHALAVDERRGNFSPTLFYHHKDTRDANTVLRQCWFPGYHGDCGGHSDADACTNSVDSLTFAWMIDQLTSKGLLQFSRPQLYYPVLRRIHDGLPNEPDTPAPKSVEEASERRIQWSDGALNDTNSWSYNFSSFIATRRLWHIRTPGEWKMASGEDVDLPDLEETIHPSVAHRVNRPNSKYQPAGLPQKEWSYRAASKGGYEWARTVNGKEVAVVPEYVPVTIEKQDYLENNKNLWSGSLEKCLAPEDVLGKEEYERVKADVLGQVKVLRRNVE